MSEERTPLRKEDLAEYAQWAARAVVRKAPLTGPQPTAKDLMIEPGREEEQCDQSAKYTVAKKRALLLSGQNTRTRCTQTEEL
jgi:hypothetical protein